MRRRTFAFVALACALVGCTIFAPEPDRAQFFVLTPVVEAGAPVDRSLTLGIGPVIVANYLIRPQIVRRVGDNRVGFSQDIVWAEPLDRGVRRVLAEDLSRLLGTVNTIQYPWSAATLVDYEVPVELLRFEADERGTVSLEARWALRRRGEKALLLTRESQLVESSKGASPAATVRAMSEALGHLSGEIAATIRSVVGDRAAQSR